MCLCFRFAHTAKGQGQLWAVVYPGVKGCSTCPVGARKAPCISSSGNSSNESSYSQMVHLVN
jgi:hypothetical protein